ncbi:OmpA family protein [Aquimarina sp. 2201CG14-23]|uniref:OmpA family protein n=1 Tax=Aquimarina mycalae TaxID=3040073 RepID=UPI0024780674|nr:OmpA family protein [Aquimarina sp. 2201CG14-23]MDH7444454.1 OmpA family protein [Aquimarina sp. 2201CG14-23]
MNSPKSNLCLLLIIIFILGINQDAKAQNLIPNPSFENTNAAVKKLKHEMRNFGVISNWKSLTNSPDAHHPAVKDVKFSHKAPGFLKQFGPQEPRTGEGKVGLYVTSNNTKESIVTKLISPLKAGKYYYFHMYVSLGEGRSSNSCTSSIGSYFTARVPRITETSQYKLHIESSEMVCDTKEWTKVCGVYKAKGTEKYVSLGYFSDNPNGKSLKGGPFSDAYYYIDDVELREMQDVQGVAVDNICNMALDFSDIEYLIGESEVYEEIKEALDSYLQYLKVFKFDSIKIVGHANDSEIEFENEILSAARAGFVREYLVENGIDESLIEYAGVSNSEPKEGEGIDNSELGSNARVQIIIE